MTRPANWPARFEGHEYPQIIPEPQDVVAGAPAPWSSLAPEFRRGFTLAMVMERLRTARRHLDDSPMPGDPAEMAAVAEARRQAVTHRSAVLVALFEEAGETHVILTRRSFAMRSHRGEIALPGGRSDAGETPVVTALREAREEVGLGEELVDPIGWLSPIVTFALGSAIWPVVGRLAERPALVADPREVDRVFTVTLRDLVADGAFLEEHWRREQPRPGADAEGYFPMYFYAVPGDVIWGATARVLTELLCLVTGVAWPDAHRVWA
jgi:8-oxo-dGTP pyrophosphatase MutT (NUDIX family)